MKSIKRLWREFKLGYYRWRLENINNAMICTRKQINTSSGTMKCWASEDLLELAEDRIEALSKIKQLERQLTESEQ